MQALFNSPDFFGPRTFNYLEVSAMFLKEIPARNRDNYFTVAASDCLKAITVYLSVGRWGQKPQSTLENITAMVLYHDYMAMLDILVSDTYARPFMKVLQDTLNQGAKGQAGMVMIGLQGSFAHLTPSSAATERINDFMQREAHLLSEGTQ